MHDLKLHHIPPSAYALPRPTFPDSFFFFFRDATLLLSGHFLCFSVYMEKSLRRQMQSHCNLEESGLDALEAVSSQMVLFFPAIYQQKQILCGL